MNNETKILHIIDSLGLGGAQTVVKGIFEYQPDNKNIFLFALRKRNILMEVKHPNVKVFSSVKKYSLKPLFELRDLIRKEKIDILHCHLFRSNIFGIILKIFWFPKIKLIVHEQGGITEDGLVYRFFLKFFKKKINFFLACSKAMEDGLIESANINKSKIIVIYNFIDLNKFNFKNITWNIKSERTSLGVNSSDFLVGFAGRLVERKGWKDFVIAANTLSKKYTNMKFIIVGDGVQKNKMLKLISKLNLKKQILYVGYKSNMVWFYSLLDCFVIPSHWEPMGLTEIEAQAMGIPVLAANVSGLNEIIKDKKNGLLFKVKDCADLVEKIELIHDNTVLKESIKMIALEDVRKYNLDSYIIKLEKVYSELR